MSAGDGADSSVGAPGLCDACGASPEIPSRVWGDGKTKEVPPRGGTSLVLPSHQTRDAISGEAPHASHRPGAPTDESAPSPADMSPDHVSCTTPHSHQALRPKGGARGTRNHPPEQVFSEQRPPRG